jgi:UDPglucose 6-dehydrogenase
MIGIIGLGSVGMALAETLKTRHAMLHCDPALTDGVPLERVATECTVVFVCVPTPPAASGAADVSIVRAVVAGIAEAAAKSDEPPLVVLKSTLPPRTTQALATAHPGLPLVVCPEFLRHGSAMADMAQANRVLLGLPAPQPSLVQLTSLKALVHELSPIASIITTDATTAELVKHATNAFLALKVVFANQMADTCEALGVDYPDFARLLALDARIGDSHLQVPGADGERGFGGACLPKDLDALVAAAMPHVPLLKAAADWNRQKRKKNT